MKASNLTRNTGQKTKQRQNPEWYTLVCYTTVTMACVIGSVIAKHNTEWPSTNQSCQKKKIAVATASEFKSGPLQCTDNLSLHLEHLYILILYNV